MSEFEARTEALRQALLAGKENEKAEVTIARAKAFLAFLSPMSVSTSDASVLCTVSENAAKKKAPAAPRKRGRPRKVA